MTLLPAAVICLPLPCKTLFLLPSTHHIPHTASPITQFPRLRTTDESSLKFRDDCAIHRESIINTYEKKQRMNFYASGTEVRRICSARVSTLLQQPTWRCR